ncbi:GNAT family N-acetyltransferase [Rossellomorea aquimaris]|uniref:GNAT family N-acetyltransferase n=1 Tax=Rossellomorea aquimaris TaxID=189382 RepID=UPI0007D0AC95|nr:GNAT family N-acetyltransferase [Rossellomorea aquimaris]
MKPISLIEFPEYIETARLIIRPCKPGDGIEVHDAIEKSRNELKSWLPFARKEQSVQEVEAGIRDSYGDFIKKTDIRLHIYLKETREFVGSSGFHRIDWEIPKVEIGYWLHSHHTKKGYITEAVEALTSFALHTLSCQRIEIRCDEENTPSRKVPEKLGYVLEAVLQHVAVNEEGKKRNTCIYAVIPNDWSHKNS